MDSSDNLKKHLNDFLTGKPTEDNVVSNAETTMHSDDHGDYHTEYAPQQP